MRQMELIATDFRYDLIKEKKRPRTKGCGNMVNVFTMRSEKKAAGHIQPITRPTLSKLLSFKIGDTTFQDQITNRLILRLRTCKGSVGRPFLQLRCLEIRQLKFLNRINFVNRRILMFKNCEKVGRGVLRILSGSETSTGEFQG